MWANIFLWVAATVAGVAGFAVAADKQKSWLTVATPGEGSIANTFAMTRVPQDFFANELAATAIEYVLVTGGVLIAIVTVLTRFGDILNNCFVTLVKVSVVLCSIIFLIFVAYPYKSHS